MADIVCAGADVLSARCHFPERGAWEIRAVLDTATLPSGRVTFAATNGLSATGTIVEGGVFLDSAHVRIVGGAGGLGTIVSPAAYQNAQLRDPLNAVLGNAGETPSDSIDASITGVLLPIWTTVAQRASEALNRLCYAAGQALGKSILWRVLDDGTVWLGEETWPSASLPEGSDVLQFFPDEQRYEVGAQTPSLLPGVNLDGVGNVAAVDHYVDHSEVRTHLWLA